MRASSVFCRRPGSLCYGFDSAFCRSLIDTPGCAVAASAESFDKLPFLVTLLGLALTVFPSSFRNRPLYRMMNITDVLYTICCALSIKTPCPLCRKRQDRMRCGILRRIAARIGALPQAIRRRAGFSHVFLLHSVRDRDSMGCINRDQGDDGLWKNLLFLHCGMLRRKRKRPQNGSTANGAYRRKHIRLVWSVI